MNKKTMGLTTTFVLMATTALSQTTKQDVIDELTEQGFQRIEITNTLFGNLRFEATGPGIEREVVLGKDGTIVRDRSERDDEYDDEEDDDRDFDDEDDDEGFDDEEDDGEGDDSERDDEGDDGERDDGGESDGEGDDGEGDDD